MLFNLSMDFEQAVELVSSLHGIDPESMLTLYGLYKVSTIGKCTIPRPSLFEFQNRAKYDNWKSISDTTTTDEAKLLYISLVESLMENSTPKDESKKGWVNVSTMGTEPIVEPKDVFDHAKQNNLEYLKTHLNELSLVDKNQMTCLHWACDRGHLEIVRFLMGKVGLDIQDEDGNTALHLAKIADREKVVEILCEHGANANIKNNDGDIIASL
jgi:acyl-CoA-binding protein